MSLQIVGMLVFAWVQASIGAADEPCGNAADIAFVLDSSRSIYYKNFNIEKLFVSNLVNRFDIGPDKTQVAVLQFGREVDIEFNFNEFSSQADINARVNKTKQSNGDVTYTHLALEAVRTKLFQPSNGARPNVPKICILLTDGQSTQMKMTQQEATLAKEDGITLLAIGVGNVNKKELENLVTPEAKDNFFYISDFKEMNKVSFQKVVGQQACKVITTTAAPTTTTPVPPTTTTVTTTTTEPPTTTPTTTTIPTTTEEMLKDRPAPETEKKCQGKAADVVFVLDMSSSIWRKDFEEQLEFVANVTKLFDIKSGKTQVGAIVYSDNASVVFNLNTYKNQKDIAADILGIKSEGGITNTHKALQLAIDESFSKQYGSRSGVAHILVLITDGRSSVRAETEKVAQLIHDRGIYLFAIGVGNMTDEAELVKVASKPAKDYMIEVKGYNALAKIKNILAYKTCETPQGDQPPCAKDVDASIVFGLYNIGGAHRSHVAQFIESVSAGLDLDKVEIGMAEHCGAANFDISEFYSTEELNAVVQDSMAMGIQSLLLDARRMLYRGSRASKTLVLFVSGAINDIGSLGKNVERLKAFARVIIVRVGEATAQLEDLYALASYKNKYQKDKTHILSLTDSFAVSQLLKLMCKAQ